MNSSVDNRIEKARQRLAVQDRDEAAALLDAALALEPLNLEAHNLKEQQRLPGNFSDWIGVNAEISPDDDIFRFFANHATSKNPVRDYLSDGWRTMIELEEILDIHNKKIAKTTSFLEFASGHGRFTRHLARKLPSSQLTVSDVVPGSVDFLTKTFGVKGFYSSTEPQKLEIPEKYDIIFVLSLFSHLPPNIWGAWIRLLYAALKPGGILILSTHGEKCAKLANVRWDQSEHVFYESSESSVLSGGTYGCTYASADYVKRSLYEILGESAEIELVPNQFWGNQDAVTVSARI